MSQLRMSGKKLWLTSAGAVVVVAGLLAGTMLANAAGPSLPARTPAQLLADMQQAKAPSAFSGVISESANLGFPSLPNIGGLSSSTLSASNWISGTHTVDIWYGGPGHVRVAVPVSFGETDLRVNGNEVWLWDSQSQTATHYVLPASPVPAPVKPGALRTCFALARKHWVPAAGASRPIPKSVRDKVLKCLRAKLPAGTIIGHAGRALPAATPTTPLTPQQIADRLLTAIGPTTSVTVPGTVTVAGRPAYQLVISPRTDQSLIGRIVIDVDSQTYVPLSVQVFARDGGSPAFSVGFTSLSFATPAASNFTFSPPAGAHVKTVKLPAGGLPGAGLLGVPSVVGPLGVPSGHGPSAGPAVGSSLRLRISLRIKLHDGRQVHVAPSVVRNTFPAAVPAMPGNGAAAGAVRVLGKGWLSVAVVSSATALSSLGGGGGLLSWAGATSVASSTRASFGTLTVSPTEASVRAVHAGPPLGQYLALLRVLLNAAKPVHGSWGSGRLLQTTLLNALITSTGKVLIGAVTPAVLYADAARVK
jgi:outer membrane lipoprotein-sorting protein